ncbi:MAG: SOS response-associated peptidase [Proteobacteria bacterium]|nr:SOS response-associated peptidase [Pseudomonadota bacterium]
MCGRYTITSDAATIAEHFDLPALGVPWRQRFNIAPSQSVPIVRLDDAARPELVSVAWNLLPPWVRDPRRGARPINARAETVEGKPFFCQAWRRRRCLLVADGFYEWQRRRRGKQPYWLRATRGGPIAFAGLWERWTADPESEAIESCTLLTTRANAVVQSIHDRMPVILPPSAYARWLAPAAGPALDALKTLLVPASDELLQAVAVTAYVNDPKHDDPGCIAAAERACAWSFDDGEDSGPAPAPTE